PCFEFALNGATALAFSVDDWSVHHGAPVMHLHVCRSNEGEGDEREGSSQKIDASCGSTRANKESAAERDTGAVTAVASVAGGSTAVTPTSQDAGAQFSRCEIPAGIFPSDRCAFAMCGQIRLYVE